MEVMTTISPAVKHGYSHPPGSVRVCGAHSFGQAESRAVNVRQFLKEGVRL